MPKVAILMGSASDNPVMVQAKNILKDFGVKVEEKVLSAHRNPDKVAQFSRTAKDNGIKVIIAGAGMAAHLAGAIAAQTTLPVIGVPIKSDGLGGMDALLSTVQMPGGVPVATVAINGAKNAAILAVQILAIEDEKLSVALDDYKRQISRPKVAVNKAVEDRPVIDG